MNEEARKARALAQKKYREEHRDQLNAYRREWAKKNPDKIAAQRERYWTKKAKEILGLDA